MQCVSSILNVLKPTDIRFFFHLNFFLYTITCSMLLYFGIPSSCWYNFYLLVENQFCYYLSSFLNLLCDFFYITEFIYDVNVIFRPWSFRNWCVHSDYILRVYHYNNLLYICIITLFNNYVSGNVTSDENTYVTKCISHFLSIILPTLLLAENEPLLFCGCH